MRFRVGDRIKLKTIYNLDILCRTPLFEIFDNPLRITQVNKETGFYFWMPRIGRSEGCGRIERIDQDYKLTFWSNIRNFLRSRYDKKKLSA